MDSFGSDEEYQDGKIKKKVTGKKSDFKLPAPPKIKNTGALVLR